MDDPDPNTPPAPSFGTGGRYVVRRELGRGTMGVVYEAEDTVLGRVVAVKTIELAFRVSDEEYEPFEQRFFNEARVAAKLSHPGIVVCHDVGKDPGSGKLFIVFEYLEGRTLAERLAAGPITWQEGLAITVRVARAIHHAHDHGVIHRDLKPANIMLLEPGDPRGLGPGDDRAVKIMDFGVARLESVALRLTRTGQSFGSPLYTSPEQALGQTSSARSDIFSLGSILCTLLLGRPWFDAPSIPEIVARVIDSDAPVVSIERPGLPGTLDWIVALALAKQPEERYPSAAALAEDLEDVLAGDLPRHAGGRPTPGEAPGEPGDEAALLAGLVSPAATHGGRSADPADLLAALLDEMPEPAPGVKATPEGPPAGIAAPAPPATAGAAQPTPPRKAAARGGGPALMKVGLALLGVVAVAAAFVLRSGPARRQASLERNHPPATVPSATPRATPSAPASLDTSGPILATPGAPVPSPTRAPRSSARTPGGEPPPIGGRAPAASPPAAVATPEASARSEEPTGSRERTRLRLSVEHPLESGRLVVWIDGVLVFETKLHAPVSRKIIAIKVREGHLEHMLDVAPGRHEVRVEVRWDDERRVETQIADVAAGSTGLLEVRVAGLTKGLSLEWSALAER